MRERTQGRRVLETVAAVLPDQFRWTAGTNCFSGLNRAVLSLPVPSLVAHLARTCRSIRGVSPVRMDQFAIVVRLSPFSSPSFHFILTAALSHPIVHSFRVLTLYSLVV